MKNYFCFNLTGKKYFPIWILFLIFFVAPYVILILKTTGIHHESSPSVLIFPILILLIIAAFAFSFYTFKLTIENIFYQDRSMKFTGTLGKFIGKVLLGLFLSIITIGIYTAWFINDMHKYFINNSSYNSEYLEFNGKGGKLFVILSLTLMIPMIILITIMTMYIVGHPDNALLIGRVFQISMVLVLIPYMYYIYKWMVNVSYKGYIMYWETKFWNSCGKIAIEIIFSMITIGIFAPLAMVRLYKYFADKTIVVADDSKLKFGYDIDQLNDFLFMWGQMLLTIITLSIYYPWAYCNIRSRILSKTYLIKISGV